PQLNALFQAFDALGNRLGQKFWTERRDRLPLGYIGGLEFAPYRRIAETPADANQATALLCAVIENQVERLEGILGVHQEIETDEMAERYDRAALDFSPGFERHRRYISAKHRELMRTLDALWKMRNAEFATEQVVASGQSPVTSEQVVAGSEEAAEGEQPVVSVEEKQTEEVVTQENV